MPPTPTERQCAVCGLEGVAVCSRCNAVFYCGRDHQALHWKAGHKGACLPLGADGSGEKKPASAAEAVRIGYELLEDGRCEEAIAHLEVGTKAYPSNKSLHVNLANCYADAGRAEDAQRAYTECVAQWPGSFEARANFAMFLQQSGRAAEAVGQFKHALELSPEWFEGYYNLGNVLAEMGPEMESAALDAYQQALRVDPHEADAHTNCGLLLQRSGRLADALVHAREATRLAPRVPNVWLNLAGLLLFCGEMQEALECAKKSVALAPHSAPAHACLAAMYELSDSPEAAVPYHEQSLKLATSGTGKASPETVLEYAMRTYALLSRLGREQEARACMAGYVTDDILSGLHDARVAEYPAAVQELDRALVMAMAGRWEDARHALARGDPSVDAVSQCSLVAMSSLSVPHMEYLTHKCRLAEHLKAAGLARLIPQSEIVRTVNDVHAAVERSGSGGGGRAWYLKDPHMQRGQGVVVFVYGDGDGWAEVERLLSGGTKEFVLQTSVSDLALLDNRKFGLRIHALVVAIGKKWSVAVFRESVLTKCASEFSATETDPLVQITCTSVQRSLPGYEREKVKGPGSELFSSHYAEVFPRIKESVLASVRSGVHAGAVVSTPLSDQSLSFQLLGYDFLVDSNMQPVLLEINASPQFGDPQSMTSLRHTLAIPMLNGVPVVLVSIATRMSSSGVDTDVRAHGWEGAGDFELEL